MKQGYESNGYKIIENLPPLLLPLVEPERVSMIKSTQYRVDERIVSELKSHWFKPEVSENSRYSKL